MRTKKVRIDRRKPQRNPGTLRMKGKVFSKKVVEAQLRGEPRPAGSPC